MDDQTTTLVTIEDLCDILSIGRNTAYHLLNSKQIKAFQIGRTWKIPLSSISEFVQRQCNH